VDIELPKLDTKEAVDRETLTDPHRVSSFLTRDVAAQRKARLPASPPISFKSSTPEFLT
jgi:hypothetical protein